MGALVGLCAALAGCGGGAASASIGGSVSGLLSGGSVTLQDNNSDSLTLTANGTFAFSKLVDPGGGYSVTVVAQPVAQTCQVSNGAGTVDSIGDDVSNVAVTCSLTSSVGGTVAGLAQGNSVWLSTNGQTLAVAANGAFAFPGVLPAGTSYNVTVSVQPAQQTCVVSNPSGVSASGVLASVAVNCS